MKATDDAVSTELMMMLSFHGYYPHVIDVIVVESEDDGEQGCTLLEQQRELHLGAKQVKYVLIVSQRKRPRRLVAQEMIKMNLVVERTLSDTLHEQCLSRGARTDGDKNSESQAHIES